MSIINGTRLYDHLTRLGRIGFVPKEGTTRLPYTPAYDEGRIYVQQCMEQAGLQTSVDPVGNLIGTLPGQGEIICIGSHIDTVPGAGFTTEPMVCCPESSVCSALRSWDIKIGIPSR